MREGIVMAEGTFNYNPEANYDEETLQQQREIDNEIARDQPLISPQLTFDQIVEEYAKEDDIYRGKIKDVKTRYKNLRKTRGDGNCFFRGFGFAYLEQLLTDAEAAEKFHTLMSGKKDELVKLGFPQFTIEDFHDTCMDIVEKVKNGCSLEQLYETFTNQGLSDYFVVYLRLIVSGHLQKNAEFFQNFIEGERTVKEFCQQEVEPMGRESDHIHIIALSSALEVGVRVEYMDRAHEVHCNHHDFPEDQSPRVFLLYRPGHYDILYPL